MAITSEDRVLELGNATVFVRQRGPQGAPPVLFLHGWPEDHTAWDRVTDLAATSHRCLSIDLPGIGRSSLPTPNGDADFLAHIIREMVTALALTDLTIVGHDVGGMIAFSYLKEYDDLRAAVIMDTVIPGIPPWETVLANPFLWHFAFHSIPGLPERLVQHDIAAYFDFFFDAIAATPDAITRTARDQYVSSYSSPGALSQGFEFYRAFAAGARRNQADTTPVDTATLYLRGEQEGGRLLDYERGLLGAGVRHLTTASIPASGHFAPEEAPSEVWAAIHRHIESAGHQSGPRPARPGAPGA